jgi:hypothetical protein
MGAMVAGLGLERGQRAPETGTSVQGFEQFNHKNMLYHILLVRGSGVCFCATFSSIGKKETLFSKSMCCHELFKANSTPRACENKRFEHLAY